MRIPKYVAINIHKGLHLFATNFGIALAPAIFQRTMAIILQEAKASQAISTTLSSRESLIRSTSKTLRKLSNVSCATECTFYVEVQFSATECWLSGTLDWCREGIHSLEGKLRAVVQFFVPKNVQELRLFLGLINYSSKFICKAGTIMALLNILLQRKQIGASKGFISSKGFMWYRDLNTKLKVVLFSRH